MYIHRIGEVTVLNDSIEIPGLGFLPVNAYVLHAEQPVVIDTGLSTVDKDFVSALAEVIDPVDVWWLWITHPDRDHTGGLWKLLQAAPSARLVTTFLGLGIMSCEWAIPPRSRLPAQPGPGSRRR
jgi:flavorubredoxin